MESEICTSTSGESPKTTENSVVLDEENVNSETPSQHIHLNDASYLEQNVKLESRLKSLREIMGMLRIQLAQEKEGWRREINEALNMAKCVGISSSDHESCHCYSDNHSIKSDSDMVIEPTVSETMLDYEKKLASYQEALTRAHADRRNLIKRQLAANAYKKRLMEVENMCNTELMKVRQNVQFLQPLQRMALNWKSQVMFFLVIVKLVIYY